MPASRADATSVEVLVRSRVRWYAAREPYTPRGPLAARLYRLAYPVVGFGPPPLTASSSTRISFPACRHRRGRVTLDSR